MPDSLLLRCPWTLLHSWSFESGTFEGLVPSGSTTIIEDPSMGHALQIIVAKGTYGGGSATGLLDTAPYHDVTKAYKIEFWYWCDYASNGWYRPSISLQIETPEGFRPVARDLVNRSFLCLTDTFPNYARRSPGVWYRGVIMIWATEDIIDYFVYDADGGLLCHSRGTYLSVYYGRPTAIRANVASSYALDYNVDIRFANIAVSYTPSLPPDPSLRRRRAAWMNMERPLF